MLWNVPSEPLVAGARADVNRIRFHAEYETGILNDFRLSVAYELKHEFDAVAATKALSRKTNHFVQAKLERLVIEQPEAAVCLGVVYSVAIAGNTAVVGSNSEAAYVFRYNGAAWQQQTKLTAADGAANDLFGEAVAASGATAVVGARRNDDDGNDSGSAYVYGLFPPPRPAPAVPVIGVAMLAGALLCLGVVASARRGSSRHAQHAR